MLFTGKKIIQFKLAGLAIPAGSILTPSNPFFHGVASPKYAPERSKQRLKELGLEGVSLTIKSSNNPTVGWAHACFSKSAQSKWELKLR